MTDPIRLFAWLCVVVGILITGLSPVYTWRENEHRAWAADPRTYALVQKGYSFAMPEYETISPWPGIGVGACVTAFGVLLLAIRPPKGGKKTARGLFLALVVLLMTSPAAAQYRYPNLYDAVQDGARQGAREGAIEAERERQRNEEDREAARRAAEKRAREDAVRGAASREYWRRENERLAPAYQRLMTPEGQAQAAAYAAQERETYRAELARIATTVRSLAGMMLDDAVIDRVAELVGNATGLRDRYTVLLPGSTRVDNGSASLASATFDAITAMAQAVESRRAERGHIARIAELEAEQMKPPRQQRFDVDPVNLKVNRERLAKRTDETAALWRAAQAKIAAIP